MAPVEPAVAPVEPLAITFPHSRCINNILNGPKAKNDRLLKEGLGDMLNRWERSKIAIKAGLENYDYSLVEERLWDYRDRAKNYETTIGNKVLGERSKFYSSIIEEFLILMMEPTVRRVIANKPGQYVLGAHTCVIRMEPSESGVWCGTKDIDTAFARASTHGNILLVGAETKKYLDKTMASGAAYTKMTLDKHFPQAKYSMVMEDEAREVDESLHFELAGSTFCLSGKKRKRDGKKEMLNRFDPTTIQRLHTHLISDIETCML